jgi:hypothetical protein
MTTAQKKTTTTSLELPKNPFVFEILDLVSKQRSKAKKVEVLKKYDDPSLKAVLIWNFDDSIITLLPEGEVPYSGYEEQSKNKGSLTTKITEEVRKMHTTGSFSLGASDRQGHTTIRREFKHFYQFIKGGNDGLNNIRRETMFINILEGLHPLEAEILCLVKDKKLSDKYKITKEIVAEAYPDIKWGGRS